MPIVKAIAAVKFDPLNIPITLAAGGRHIGIIAKYRLAIVIPNDLGSIPEGYSFSSCCRAAGHTSCQEIVTESDINLLPEQKTCRDECTQLLYILNYLTIPALPSCRYEPSDDLISCTRPLELACCA